MAIIRITDPFDPTGDDMLLDTEQKMTVTIDEHWCSGCKANVKWVGGRWSYWLGEPDKWYCEACK